MTSSWFALTHAGHVRVSNEDAYCCDAELGLYVVADGMGGHNAGEVASTMAVETVRNFVEISHREREFTWPYGVDPRVSYEGNRLVTAIRLANRQVLRQAETHGAYTGMGTTVVAALLAGSRLTFVNVGDSRLYVYRSGELRQLTKDDTLVATLLEQNPQLDPATLTNHPMRHVLTCVVGAREEIEARANEHDMADGDTLLLCTDGLTDLVTDAEIAAILSAGHDIETSVRLLRDRAMDAGGTDNVTAVLVRCLGAA